MFVDSINRAFEELNKKDHIENITRITEFPWRHFQDTSKNDEDRIFLTCFTFAFNHWLDVPADKLKLIISIFDNMLDAGLMLDDIVDTSLGRGGIPACHLVYGVKFTLNSTIQLMVTNMEPVIELDHPDAFKVYIHHGASALRGQTLESYYSLRGISVEEYEYVGTIFYKTSDYFLFAAELMKSFSKRKDDFKKFMQLCGLYYQILNDLNNLTFEEYNETKGAIGEDITEGKYSFAISTAIRMEKPDRKILDIVNQRTRDPVMKMYCLELIKKTSALEYTQRCLDKLEPLVRAEMNKFGPNPVFEKYFNDLTNWKSKTQK